MSNNIQPCAAVMQRCSSAVSSGSRSHSVSISSSSSSSKIDSCTDEREIIRTLNIRNYRAFTYTHYYSYSPTPDSVLILPGNYTINSFPYSISTDPPDGSDTAVRLVPNTESRPNCRLSTAFDVVELKFGHQTVWQWIGLMHVGWVLRYVRGCTGNHLGLMVARFCLWFCWN